MISKILVDSPFNHIANLDNSPIDSRVTTFKRSGGISTNVLVFMSVACVVGFVSWLLLQHLVFKNLENDVTENVPEMLSSEEELIVVEKPPELTPEERLQIQQELDRRNAETERMLAEKKEELKQQRKIRIAKNLSAAEEAIAAKQWKLAETHIGLLLDDSYSFEAAVKFKDLIEKAKLKESVDLLMVGKFLDAAQNLDTGEYSPIAIDLLDKALLIVPNHPSSLALRKKINAYSYSLRVPEDVATLNAAVEMLRAGDTAILSEGVHKFSALLNKGIKIKGQGENLTFIECDTRVTSAFTLTGIDQSYLISDLTVMGTSYEDDAVERFPLIMLAVNLTMRNVTVKNGSGHGVAVISGRLNMVKCKLTENAWDGVSIMGAKSYAEITDCDVSGNYDHGVDFWNGASGKLTNVTVNQNSGSGILIMGKVAKVHLVQVKSERNSQCGIVINSQAQAKLERVFSARNQLSGIVVQGRGTKLTCGLTVSNENGEAGFFIDPAATIENFIATTAEGNGIGDVIRKAMIPPKIPVPPAAVPVPAVNSKEI